jgi:hypothetical protein
MKPRGRWERLYSDDGECLRDRVTGCEVVTRKQYGNPRWSVTVWRVCSRPGGGIDKECLYSDDTYSRRQRPTRSDLAELVDAIHAEQREG